MREHIESAADVIDAGVFTGDLLQDPKERAELKEYIVRWQRAIAEAEKATED